jgi:uncharacterized membrane protein
MAIIMILAIVISIGLVIALGVTKESYRYTSDYDRAEEPDDSLVAGTLYASPGHHAGMGWVL